MSVRSVKRWQWVVAALLAGLVVAAAQLLARGEERFGGEGFISRQEFERNLRAPEFEGKSRARSVVVRPAAHVDVVSLEALDLGTQTYRSVRFAAARPYTPVGQAVPTDPPISVREFLLTLSAANPALYPHYAWWEEWRIFTAIRMLVGAVVIGGIWPLVVRVLAGPPIPDEVDFSGVKDVRSAPAHEPERGLSDEERKRLEELEAEMIAALKGGGDRPQHVAGEQTRLPRELHTEEVSEIPVAPQEDKDFAGEYYPVEKKVPRDK